MTGQQRTYTLSELARHTGKVVPWQFLTNPQISNIERFHYIISGIYKPKWSDYALSITLSIKSPYHTDEIIHLKDGSWLLEYAPRTGGLNHPENRALTKCLNDSVPIGVFKQITDKTSAQGSTYQILGLGMITEYDPTHNVFRIQSANNALLDQVTAIIPDEQLRYQTQLYARLTNQFQPFLSAERAAYVTNLPQRDPAFRKLIMQEYDFTCAVCELKFHLNDLTEATAAHIIPKRQNGTDDPRNGLALCHTHHWAFDAGLFTLNDNYQITLSQTAVEQADTRNFDLLQMQNKPIHLPDNQILRPHPQAITWHQQHIWHQ